MLKKYDTLSKEAEKQLFDTIITRINEIGDDEAGIIAAQDIIDSVLQAYGPEIYNMSLRDTKKLLQEKFYDIETELDILKQE